MSRSIESVVDKNQMNQITEAMTMTARELAVKLLKEPDNEVVIFRQWLNNGVAEGNWTSPFLTYKGVEQPDGSIVVTTRIG